MKQLYLTRRNLLTLLNKLDRVKDGGASTCSLIKYNNGGKFCQTMDDSVVVTAIEDEEYYAEQERQAGHVLPVDEP